MILKRLGERIMVFENLKEAIRVCISRTENREELLKVLEEEAKILREQIERDTHKVD